jgi:hypothetical protein
MQKDKSNIWMRQDQTRHERTTGEEKEDKTRQIERKRLDKTIKHKEKDNKTRECNTTREHERQ